MDTTNPLERRSERKRKLAIWQIALIAGVSMLAWVPAIALIRNGDWNLGIGERPPRPESNWTLEDARSFHEYSLYWLGDDYEGLPLTSMRRTRDSDEVTHSQFNYGEPSYYGDGFSGSWHSPLEIDIQTYCGYSPQELVSYERYADDYDRTVVSIRGVEGYLERYPPSGWEYLTLWTGLSTIHLSVTPKSGVDIEAAAADLISIYAQNGPKETLPPPPTTPC